MYGDEPSSQTGAADRTQQTTGLATTRLHGMILAFDAGEVRDVIDARDPRRLAELEEIDLATVLGLQVTDVVASARERRVLLMNTDPAVLMIVGEDVRLVARATLGCQDLPYFLEGLRETVGIAGIIELEGTFGYLLDAQRLVRSRR